MQTAGQLVVNAILLGSVYAVTAAGFALVYGVMNILNAAHGSFIMLGAYAAYSLSRILSIEPLLLVPGAMVALFATGFAIQRTLFNRLLGRNIFIVFILTFGLDMVLINLALGIWGGEYCSVGSALRGAGLDVLGVRLSYLRLVVAAWGVLVIVGLILLMSKTGLGLAIQATALEMESAQLAGIDVKRIYAITLGISAGLAGAAGSLLASISAVHPFMGEALLSRAFAVVVLGGLGSVKGALVAGFLLAAVETVGGYFLGGGWSGAIAFVMFVIVLIVQPQGLFGKKFFAEVVM